MIPVWDIFICRSSHIICCGIMEILVRVDRRGRIVIPSEVRRSLGIGRVVRLRVREGRIILEAVKDPVERLMELVSKAPSSGDVVEDQFEEALEEQLERLVREAG